jgi:dephospho-CoA kinase
MAVAAEAFAGKRIVGLTGNIATGKSAVLSLAREHGALTIDADEVVHDLLNNDRLLQQAIAEAFGEAMRRPDNRIDRTALGALVFSNQQALSQLEQLVHPHVRQHILARIRESDAPVVVIEAIKLLEGGLSALCDEIWVTTCSYDQQLQRLRICRGMAEEEAVARIRAQSPAEEKVAQADVVIDTNGLLQDTRRQFASAWDHLLAAS